MRIHHVVIICCFWAGLCTIGNDQPDVHARELFTKVKVKKGQTLYRIAKEHHLSVSELSGLNQITKPKSLQIGQILRVPLQTKAIVRKQLKESKTVTKKALPRHALSRGSLLGRFTLTAYTAGIESTGKKKTHPAYKVTSSGAKVMDGLTIAVDPKIIPIGSRVYIEGVGYRVAQDIGSAIQGKRIDLFMSDLQEARKFGVQRNVKVEIMD